MLKTSLLPDTSQAGIMGNWSQKSRCFYSVWVREGLSDPGDAEMIQDTSQGSPDLMFVNIQPDSTDCLFLMTSDYIPEASNYPGSVIISTSKASPLLSAQSLLVPCFCQTPDTCCPSQVSGWWLGSVRGHPGPRLRRGDN